MLTWGEKMKYNDLVRALKKAGWSIEHGGNHDIARNPQKPAVRIPLPRHKEVNEYTAMTILKAAGIGKEP